LALDEPASFTFRIENAGNVTATSVRLDVTTPDDAVLSSTAGGCAPTATGVTCALDPIPPREAVTVAVTGTRRSGMLIRAQGHVSAAEPDSDLSSNDAQTNAQVLPCTIVGTGGPDLLYGTDGPDRICALPGADTIYGRGGNDYIDAGNGDDRIYPGPGQDTVIARGGDDVIYARDGQRDWIDCGAQTDVAVVDRIDVVRHCEFVLRPQP
jgi:Ca2+-binding RTX toxin-like protein